MGSVQPQIQYSTETFVKAALLRKRIRPDPNKFAGSESSLVFTENCHPKFKNKVGT